MEHLSENFSVAAADSAAASGKSRGKAPAAVAYPVNFNLVAMANLKPGDEVSLPIPGIEIGNNLAFKRLVEHLRFGGVPTRIVAMLLAVP